MKTNLIQTAVVGSCVVAAAFLAGCASPQPTVNARQDQTLSSMDQTQAGYDTFGRRWGEAPPPAPKPAPAPMPMPQPAPAPASKVGCTDPTWGLIRMNKTMPREASLGSEFAAELNITAQACAGNVIGIVCVIAVV